jgi:hypothetical protein
MKDLNEHQRAVLSLSLEELTHEAELGFDLNTIKITPGGGYKIRVMTSGDPWVRTSDGNWVLWDS